MVDEAAKFMEANREKPFFIYWAINLPHYPLQGTEKWRRRYAHIKDEKRRRYAAFMSSMDEERAALAEKAKSLKGQLEYLTKSQKALEKEMSEVMLRRR